MKKFTVILLVAVLAMTSAFAFFNAALSGDVTASYTVDFDDKTFGYTAITPNIDVKFSYTPATVSIAAVEGLSVEYAAKFYWTQTRTDFSLVHGNYDYVYLEQLDDTKGVSSIGYFYLTSPTFKIHYKDVWTLSLLSASSVGAFAASPIDTDTVKKASAYKYNNNEGAEEVVDKKTTYTYYWQNYITPYYSTNGVTMTWNGFTFAAAANGGYTDETSTKTFYTGVQTKNFQFGNGFNMQGAGSLNYTGAKEATVDSWLVSGSYKFGYTRPDGNMSFAVATDQAITFGKKPIDPRTKTALDTKVKYDVDALFTAKIYPATVNVFYANEANSYLNYTNTYSVKNLLSGKVEFDLNCFNAPIVTSIAALNVLGEAKVLNANFEITLAEKYVLSAYGLDLLATKTRTVEDPAQVDYYAEYEENQTVGVGAVLPFGPVTVETDVYAVIANKCVGASVEATYENQWFTATAGIEGEAAIDEKLGNLALSATVESTNVIKNATATIEYESLNLLKASDSYATYGLGAVTASVTVAF